MRAVIVRDTAALWALCLATLGCGDSRSGGPTTRPAQGGVGGLASYEGGRTYFSSAGVSGQDDSPRANVTQGGAGLGATPSDDSTPDASSPGGSGSNDSTSDASGPDTLAPDSSKPDASTPGAGSADASGPDASSQDAASPQGGAGPDAAGTADAAVGDELRQTLITPDSDLEVDGVELGNGRNDGTLRLYGAANRDGAGYEWTYEDGVWVVRDTYAVIGGHCTPRLGDLNGQGPQLYAGVWEDVGVAISSYETNWESVTILPGSTGKDRILAVRAADGRNDGIERLYIASDAGLFEYSYDGQVYDELRLLDTAVGEFGIGDGRNDGMTRIYVGERGGSRLHELAWSGTAFADEVVFDCDRSSQYAAHVGDGRGDGVQRVYAWCGGIHELSFESGNWARVSVDAASGMRFYIRSGRIRADNRSRLYVSQTPIGLVEYTWNADRREFDVDVVSAATGGVAIGDGRGDGRNRLYVAQGSNGSYGEAAIVELSSSEPPLAEP